MPRHQVTDENSPVEMRALAVYHALTAVAYNHELITYDKLKQMTGLRTPRVGMYTYLNRIHDYCAHNDLPSLAVLVVNNRTGRPGIGLYRHTGMTSEEADSQRMQVYRLRWYALVPPALEELA